MSYTFSCPYREERPQAVGPVKHVSEVGDLAFRESQNRIDVFKQIKCLELIMEFLERVPPLFWCNALHEISGLQHYIKGRLQHVARCECVQVENVAKEIDHKIAAGKEVIPVTHNYLFRVDVTPFTKG